MLKIRDNICLRINHVKNEIVRKKDKNIRQGGKHMIFVILFRPPHFLACKLYARKVRQKTASCSKCAKVCAMCNIVQNVLRCARCAKFCTVCKVVQKVQG